MTDIGSALDSLITNAGRLCGVPDVHVFLVEGDNRRLIASHGVPDIAALGTDTRIPRRSVTGRAITERRVIHVADLAAEIDGELEGSRPFQQRWGTRTTLAAPLLREGAPLGAIVIFLGIYPTAILDLQSPALLRLNEQVRAATTAPAPDMVAVAQTPRAASLGSEERNARSERAPQGTPE